MDKYLHLDEVDLWELMNVLLYHFSRAQNPTPFITKYQREDSPHSLELRTKEDGQIEKVIFSDGFPREQLEQIDQKIKDSLLTTDHQIGADILFCRERITGYFRYKDLFQIIPVPDNAPMPEVGLRDYPFLLQFMYTKSNDVVIDYSRRREKAVIYTRLLNLLLNQRVRLLRNNAQAYWTLNVTESPTKMSSSYRQEGYTFEGFSFVPANFTVMSGEDEIEKVPFQEYYTSKGVTFNPLKIPDDLERSLDYIFSLTPQDYDRFFRACTWYEKGQLIWEETPSSSFVAMVSAIEALIGEKTCCKSCGQDISESLLTCVKCKQSRYQSTKNFKEFIAKYVSDLDLMPKEAALLYTMRSSLVHGAKLLQQDLRPWSFMNPAHQNESQIQRNLFHITGIAIYKWLWSRKITKK